MVVVSILPDVVFVTVVFVGALLAAGEVTLDVVLSVAVVFVAAGAVAIVFVPVMSGTAAAGAAALLSVEPGALVVTGADVPAAAISGDADVLSCPDINPYASATTSTSANAKMISIVLSRGCVLPAS